MNMMEELILFLVSKTNKWMKVLINQSKYGNDIFTRFGMGFAKYVLLL